MLDDLEKILSVFRYISVGIFEIENAFESSSFQEHFTINQQSD